MATAKRVIVKKSQVRKVGKPTAEELRARARREFLKDSGHKFTKEQIARVVDAWQKA